MRQVVRLQQLIEDEQLDPERLYLDPGDLIELDDDDGDEGGD